MASARCRIFVVSEPLPGATVRDPCLQWTPPHGRAGIAENVLDAFFGQAAHDDIGAYGFHVVFLSVPALFSQPWHARIRRQLNPDRQRQHDLAL